MVCGCGRWVDVDVDGGGCGRWVDVDGGWTWTVGGRNVHVCVSVCVC